MSNWTNKSGGDWSLGANWGGVAPGPTDSATIAVAGTYTVAVTTADVAKSLTLNDATATVEAKKGGTLTLGGGTGILTLTLGTVRIDAGGTLAAGTILDTGDKTSLTFSGTQTFNPAATITLGFKGPAVGPTANDAAYLRALAGSVLTLGSKVTINASGKHSEMDSGAGATDAIINQGHINANVAGNVFRINFDPTFHTPYGGFTNQGTITDLGTDQLIVSAKTIANSGTIAANLNGRVFLGEAGSIVTNSGAISAASGSGTTPGGTVTLAGTITNTGTLSDGAATVSGATETVRGGWIVLQGLLQNAGKTLKLGGTNALNSLTLDAGGSSQTARDKPLGVISGGMIVDAGSASKDSGLKFDGGELSGVTYDGTLDLSSLLTSNNYVTIVGGITTHGVAGTGNGAINLTGNGNTVSFVGTQTLNNTAISIGGQLAGTPPIPLTDTLQLRDPTNTGSKVLTLGSGVTITHQAGVGILGISVGGAATAGGDTIVNDGTILATAASSTSIQPNFSISDNATGHGVFINNGTIRGAHGDTLSDNIGTFTNSGTIEAQTGVFTIFTGSVRTIGGTGSLKIDAGATLELNTVKIGSGQTASFGGTGGTLQLDNPANFGGKIAMTAGNQIDVKESITGASINGSDQFVLNLTGGGTQIFALSGTYAAQKLSVVSDGSSSNPGFDIKTVNAAAALFAQAAAGLGGGASGTSFAPIQENGAEAYMLAPHHA